jgi:4-cresol dehydrogenase (hydroxylating)
MSAVARWRELLGEEHVSTELEPRDVATFATTQRRVAWLRPGSAAEVATCLAIASEEGARVHPISRGKNWGYGSRVPHVDGAAVLDLSRLDRIVDFDERLAYVTVEPGVTFRQLSSYLRSCRARVWASVTGGPADASVLANALERGDGSGPLGDRFGQLCGLEVALPNGRLVHTGFARFPGSPVAPVSRWGVGPALDGVFSQGGPGVVTRATIWLAPYPAQFSLAAFRIADDAALPAMIDAVRELALAGVTTATVPVWNDLKAMSLVGQYPWDEAGGITPLPRALRDRLRDRGIGRWNGTVSLYAGSRLHAEALRGLVEQALGPVAELAFRDGPADPLAATEEECGPMLGVPHDRSAAATYWRKRMPVPAVLDPDRDRCGFLWLGHAVPCEGGHARAIADLYEEELTRDGFEAGIALLAVTPRALSAVAQIAYDRDVPGEDERARACHDRVFARAVLAGYPPFRLGVQSPRVAGEPAYDELVGAIRRALDPAGVLQSR